MRLSASFVVDHFYATKIIACRTGPAHGVGKIPTAGCRMWAFVWLKANDAYKKAPQFNDLWCFLQTSFTAFCLNQKPLID
jgi:hypothetical protein